MARSVNTPPIIYGTAWKKERTTELVALALRVGYRAVDTACQPKHYDEPGVGRALTAAFEAGLERQELYVQTKFTPLSGQDPRRVPYDPEAPLVEQVRQSCAASLRNLGVDYVDCLLLHSPLPTVVQTLAVWEVMEALVREGAAARIGISNCYELRLLETLTRKATVKPSVVQNRFYADTGFDRELRAFCRQNAITYQSFWTLTANPHLLRHASVGELAAQHGLTREQVLFRALSGIGITPLTGTTSEAHMRDDLQLFDVQLQADELARVATLFER